MNAPLSPMMRVGLMQSIESLLHRLDDGDDLNALRNAIADLISSQLQAMKESLEYWETTHFANAIAALSLNVNFLPRPTTTWLRLCLVDLEKVLVPPHQRDENSMLQDKYLEALTYEQLMEALNAIRKHD